ncbi:MAG: hypothetical protein KF716_28065 [Anaerolineae bacterium]|nr:hypothetical protein [Anaerolineae bacterium]
MQDRIDQLLAAFIILVLSVMLGVDRFVVETPLSKFFTGLLTSLTIVGGIVYVYRIASHSGQHH